MQGSNKNDRKTFPPPSSSKTPRLCASARAPLLPRQPLPMKPLHPTATASFLAVASLVTTLPTPAADLPNPQLLPTTRAIHDLVAKQPDGTEADMASYAEKLKLADNAPLDLVPIKGGEFTMGSPDSEPGRKPDEGPPHKVKIEPFWMGKLEVTWNLYRPFMENGKPRNKDGTLNRDSNLTPSPSPPLPTCPCTSRWATATPRTTPPSP